ncbi:hypothetical protein BKA65DRAFT_571106 [Rhexocercosporidium sp. MPI-PUGE-AT-0058]|nr:hypothetical protein BKA65DRAFT_571106 [Rhexocercosporidium sp. MPI-PUGE-AT-0058]
MANIYQNCVLTIAAADAVDSKGGLFRQRQRSGTHPVPFSPHISPFKDSKLVFAFGDRQETNDGLRCSSRLDTRGRVLQEQLFSPRTLDYSSQELYWECFTLTASESHPAGIPHDYDRNFERRYFMELKMKIAAIDKSSGKDREEEKVRMHMLWQHVVGIYSKSEVSNEGDKLAALAGAASQAAKVLQDKFLAGLWVKSLWRDLRWRVENVNSTTPLCSRPKEFKAQSWSWASIKGPITYGFPQGTGYVKYYPCVQILGFGDEVDFESNMISKFIKVRGIIAPTLRAPPLKDERISTQDQVGQQKTRPQLDSNHGAYWKPDIAGITHDDAQYLIVAASHGWAVCLGIMPTKRKKDEFNRVGLQAT